jgi:hypothetical protein
MKRTKRTKRKATAAGWIRALDTITGYARDWHEDLALHMSADDLAAARRVWQALIVAGSHDPR